MVLGETTVMQLQSLIESDASTEVAVDLDRREVRAGDLTASFDLDDYTRWRLMNGLDDIGLTLGRAEEITVFESNRPGWMPVTL